MFIHNLSLTAIWFFFFLIGIHSDGLISFVLQIVFDWHEYDDWIVTVSADNLVWTPLGNKLYIY